MIIVCFFKQTTEITNLSNSCATKNNHPKIQAQKRKQNSVMLKDFSWHGPEALIGVYYQHSSSPQSHAYTPYA